MASYEKNGVKVMPLSGISIYLLKGFDNISDVIRSPSGKKEKANILAQGDDYWFIGKSGGGRPDWVKFLGASVPNLNGNEEFKRFGVQSSYGLYIIKVKVKEQDDTEIDRFFAIPFGHGIHLLEMRYVEPSFGLKTVVNVVPYDELRQVDLTVPEQNSQKKKYQSSINVSTNAFTRISHQGYFDHYFFLQLCFGWSNLRVFNLKKDYLIFLRRETTYSYVCVLLRAGLCRFSMEKLACWSRLRLMNGVMLG